MPKEWDPSARDFGSSVYPLAPRCDVAPDVWHDSYPPHCPPGVESAPLRTNQLLTRAAERYPRRSAVQYYRTRWTYQELMTRVRQVAAGLQHQGLSAGDRIMLVLPNCPDFVAFWFASHYLGLEVVPANPLMTAGELSRLARQCNVRAVAGFDLRLRPVAKMLHEVKVPLLIVSGLSRHLPWHWRLGYRLQLLHAKRATVPPAVRVMHSHQFYRAWPTVLLEQQSLDVSQTAVLQPTGGTTGTPKVAMLTHANLHANVAQLHAWSGLQPGQETVLSVLPFFHVFGATVALLSPIAGGSTLVLQARFDVNRIFDTIERHRPGVVPMVPFMFGELCGEMRRRGRDLQGLSLCFCGASPLDPAVCREFQDRTGAVVIEGYGLSEASPVTHANPPNGNARSGTIGLPLPNTRADIVDSETGLCSVQPGTVGELIINGPQVMAGYLGEAEETARTIRDGWLFTGDLATMDEQGFFQIVDRKKDMIITGGLNVFPAEVENVLRRHPAVADCAVVGLPDPKYGECIAAYLVPYRGAQINSVDIEQHCRAELASYKVPRIIEVRHELPRNFLGKVRRVELRRKAA